jgi:hypothetical protein
MTFNTRHVLISLIYVAALSWIYLTEMVGFWGYMGLVGEFSVGALALSSLSAIALALLLPATRDTREYLLTCLHYMFFLPSTVFMFYSNTNSMHLASFATAVGGVYILSAVKSPVFALQPLPPRQILTIVFSLIGLSMIIQAAFGGLTYFNLDIERVYEFRRVSAAELPPIFGYLYSNVSSVLVPVALTLSIKFRNNFLALFTILCAVILFGMTHHKSVLFGPFVVALLYLFFQRNNSSRVLNWAFASILVLCLFEIFIMRQILGSSDPAYINSLIVRRVLIIPSVLDSFYTELFSIVPQYYWSTSKLGDWLVDNPHGVTAPFLIGEEYFGDTDTSANAGMIGSGYANAGLIGVAVYSALIGLLISVLNAYGRRIGHAFVTAASLSTIFNVVTSTDLVTAILTHGLLLLLLLLALFPPADAPVPESPYR